MVGPVAKRRAVRHLIESESCSERRACAVVGFHRGVYRREPRRPMQDQALRRDLRDIAAKHPRYGYRRAHVLLTRDRGWLVNRKKVQRVWREEGLKVTQRPKRRRPRGTSTATLSRDG